MLSILLMVLFSIFLVVTPLVTDPVIENFYALLSILAGFLVYIPFVYFQVKLPGTGEFWI